MVVGLGLTHGRQSLIRSAYRSFPAVGRSRKNCGRQIALVVDPNKEIGAESDATISQGPLRDAPNI